MTMTKNAVGNLIARYKTVLQNCSLMNVFGSLALAGAVVLGGASGALAESDSTSYVDTEYADNTTATSGAAFYNQETISFDGCTFTNNSATQYGGAIFNVADSGKITTLNADFIGNSASQGGAILNQSGAAITSINGTFDSNVASYLGGAISNFGTIGTIEGSFTNNDGGQRGGAIYNDGTGTITTITASFDGNFSRYAGGAIYQNGGTIGTITGSSFENNSSGTSGGAIAANSAITLITESSFTANTADANGGAIDLNGSYGEGDDYKGITNSTFTGNIAGGDGGAIYSARELSLASVTFDSNKATNGGALGITATRATTIADATFTNNTASENGGAIYNTASTITFSGENTFSGNMAGGVLNDIYNDGIINVSGNMTLDGGITGTGTTNFLAGSTLTVGENTTLEQTTITVESGASLVVAGDFTVDNITISGTAWGWDGSAYDSTSETLSTISDVLVITDVTNTESTYIVTTGAASSDVIADALGSSTSSSTVALVEAALNNQSANAAATAFIVAAAQEDNGGTIIEGAAKLAATGAVVPGLGSVNAAAGSNMGARTTIAPQAKASAAADSSNWLAMNGDGAILPTADGGNMAQGFGIWFMPMYNHTSADGFKSGSNSYGYDTDIVGATLGADYTFAGDFRLGLAFNVGSGSSSSTGDFATTENDFDYVGISVYGAKHFDALGLSFDMGYTMSENDMVQDATGGDLYGTADAALFTIGAKAEYLIPLDSFNVTPYAGIRFNYYDVDAYDTKQNGDALFSTASGDNTVWEIPVGVTFDTTTKVGSWDITPSLGLGVKFAMGDLDADQEVSIAGVADSYVLSSEVADEVTFQGALGLGFAKDACNVSLNYTLDLSENVESHGVSVNLRYEF
ncbi:MAG: autotransporter domain-containing protein [Pseudomonadota bacterium]